MKPSSHRTAIRPAPGTYQRSGVRIWPEEVVIPTYLAGAPNRNPMFLEKRVYQGSSGRVYPYPVIDRISDERTSESYRAVFLENRYLKLMVLPDFGGRIQFAYDKTNGYPFIYHNRVIKPALVGLAGPWLSGGIEFNWPQHHRPGTYCPVDWAITNNPDGSATLWLSEIEPMWHLKGTLGLTVFPDRALLEVRIRLFNPTPLPQSFHLWTNPAVHVSDHYQSVFPPDVQAVYDHGKRDVSAFPIARGEYYKVDYSRGVDISWYKNLPVPTSYMAAKSNYDFLGGYDHDRGAGVLHVANHHQVPGKKQWVWGCGEFGKAWDRNLTDEDGPYAELMCGVFADNQPDFSWLQPFEEKQTAQYFLPYKSIGYVRNATVDAAVSFEIKDHKAILGVYGTSAGRASVRLLCRGKPIWRRTLELGPEKPFVGEVGIEGAKKPQDLRVEVVGEDGRLLVAYSPELVQAEAIPDPAKAIGTPAELPDNESLYLAGLHLEQYRHATREPRGYYEEALRRDPGDIRVNNALGLLLLRRGQFGKAEPYFRTAIETLTRHNPNPAYCEPYYNLGVCLRFLRRPAEASDAFWKATWDAGCADRAWFQLAQLAATRGGLASALECAEEALKRNTANGRATHLKIMLLRKLGRTDEAQEAGREALARDPLDFGAHNEKVLLQPGEMRAGQKAELLKLMRRSPHTHLELASDYAGAGAYAEAVELLSRIANDTSSARAAGHTSAVGMPSARPMLFYFMGHYALLGGRPEQAKRFFRAAARQEPACCFPNSLDSITALEAALSVNPEDARAAYYLGNLWYDKRQDAEAKACWVRSRKLEPVFPTVHRNLAILFYNKEHDVVMALKSLERAFRLDRADARVLFELDLLKKRAGVSPADRLRSLTRYFDVVNEREDLLLEYVTLLNFFGKNEKALGLLSCRRFHPWEGGEGKVTGQYVVSLVHLARKRLRGGQPAEAVELLERARVYPENLGEGKLHGAQENHVLYWLGVAHEQTGNRREAEAFWRLAAAGLKTPMPAIYYNDQSPDTIFYQGLALRRLGRSKAARDRFKVLRKFGQEHLRDKVTIDYFAVSLPEFMVFDDNLELRNEVNCRYLSALGSFGLGRRGEALGQLRKVLKLDPAHQAAKLHLEWFSTGDA